MSNTPSYFSGTAAERMNKYARLKKQRIARQASRAFTAGTLGAQHGAPAAHEWLANNPATEYERKRAQFLEMTKAGGVVQDRRLAREEQLRQDDRARDLAVLSAELQKLQVAAANSRHSASLRANLQMKELELKIAEKEKETEELLNGNAQDRQDLRGLYEGLGASGERALGRGIQGGGAGGAGGAPGAGTPLTEEALKKATAERALGLFDFHSLQKQKDDPEATLLAGDGKVPWTTFDGSRAAYAAIYTAMVEAGFPEDAINHKSMNHIKRAAGARMKGIADLDPTTYERASGDRIRISEADPENVPAWVGEPPLVGAGSSEGSSGGSTRAPSAAYYQDNYKDFLLITDAQFASVVPDLSPDVVASLQRDREALTENAKGLVAAKVATLATMPDQAAALNRLTTFIRGVSSASPLSGEELWTVAVAQPNGPLTSYQEAFQANEEYKAQEIANLKAGVQEILDNPAAAGMDTSGVRAAMDSVNTSTGQAQPRLPGNAVDDTAQQQTEAASEAQRTQQQQEQAAQNLDDQGKVLFYGMEFDKATFPQDTAGQVELLNQLIEQYPQMPAMEQARADMMADPQFAKWMESRGYQGAPQPHHFKEYQREYRLAKKMNKMQFRRQKRVNMRAGITPGDLDDDRTISGPDYEDENKALTRRDVRDYRRSSRGEAQAVSEKDRKARPTSKASERIKARKPARNATAPQRVTKPYSITVGNNRRVEIPDSYDDAYLEDE